MFLYYSRRAMGFLVCAMFSRFYCCFQQRAFPPFTAYIHPTIVSNVFQSFICCYFRGQLNNNEFLYWTHRRNIVHSEILFQVVVSMARNQFVRHNENSLLSWEEECKKGQMNSPRLSYKMKINHINHNRIMQLFLEPLLSKRNVSRIRTEIYFHIFGRDNYLLDQPNFNFM